MKDENGDSFEKYNTFRTEGEFKGFVKARLETIGRTQKDHEDRLRRTEKSIAKIMTTASAVGATFGILFAVIGDWIKGILGLGK